MDIKKEAFSGLIEQFEFDSKALKESNRNNGAFYLIGYVIELALKEAICKYLDSEVFPPQNKGINFKLHDFDNLLILSGTMQIQASQ